MSGSNNTKQYKWRALVIVFGLLYFFVMVAFIFILYNIPGIYNQINQQHVQEMQTAVNTAIKTDDSASIEAQLAKLTNENNVDVVVLTESGTVFATLPETDFAVLKNLVNAESISYQGSYMIDVNGTTYQVWMAVFEIETQSFFIMVIAALGCFIVLLCIIMAILIALIFNKLLSPLRRLRKNIRNLKAYELAEISAGKAGNEYDALSKELEVFTVDLYGKFTTISREHTSLEQNLEAQREFNINKTQLSSALIHDLKTPLNISLLQATQLAEVVSNDGEGSRLVAELSKNNEKIIQDVNEILKVVNASSIDDYLKKERFEAIALLRSVLRLFFPLFKERQIAFEFDAPRSLIVNMNRVEFKQIIHNIIANAVQYTDQGGEFRLDLYAENGRLIIESYNDKNDVSQIDFERIFNLFYSVGQNQFGSGVGLYTIMTMVHNNNGVCSFKPFEDGVLLSVELPVIEVGHHD
ncbi:sensor histidine kinase [Culicoidibacter larvae]|uniref:histidine kinase n=1 Tax=Culicoidibacter larvae TaxID=2579976 RepID=A0A5R8QDT1_9FIRM|nr:HAMP domain-containing sensor histidine kinase [Culicoidibacter larvae]TLG75435.1 HAMP domain-containing histidine kinase [Culicoidibacter larvae]